MAHCQVVESTHAGRGVSSTASSVMVDGTSELQMRSLVGPAWVGR